MFTCHIHCHPWDLLDEGVDEVLDRLQGQVGATGITLITAGDEIELFRPHPGAEPRIYRSSGGVYFQPNERIYQATRLKPPVWEQHRKMDVLGKISEHCADRQLDLRSSISPLSCKRLVSKHPEAACKNAYGIASRSAICPLNPDVSEYLLSLVRDLSGYDDVSAIVLEEIQRPPATDPAPYVQALAMFDTEAVNLLDFCFCESCLQAADRAGVDGQAALRCTQAVLDRLCREETSDGRGMEDLMAGNQPIDQYLSWADAAWFELLGRIKDVSSKALILNCGSVDSRLLDLNIAPDLFGFADTMIIDTEDLESILSALSQGEVMSGLVTPASVGHVELLLQMDEGGIDEAPEVVRELTFAAEAGTAGVNVTHYGAIPDRQFDWIRQGLRNARRLAAP